MLLKKFALNKVNRSACTIFGTPLHKGRPYTSGKTGIIHRYTHLCRAEISLDCKGVTFFLNGLACVAVVNFDT